MLPDAASNHVKVSLPVDVSALQQQFERDLPACQTTADVAALKLKYLGRTGIIHEHMLKIRDLPADQRPAAAAELKALREFFEDSLGLSLSRLLTQERAQRMEAERIDVTLPGRRLRTGAKHPISAAIEESVRILKDLGFSIQSGPQLETVHYNLELLDFAKEQAARSTHDTFYVEPGLLLRTHATSVQSRCMGGAVSPLRIACARRCFRYGESAASSNACFHHIEVLCVDQKVSMQDLFWTVEKFLHRLFQRDLAVRFRPRYSPHLAPGVAGDATCLACGGKGGCPLCQNTGWVGVCGAGMVRPQVLKNVGIDPEKYQGFSCGVEVERLIMLKHGVRDARLFSDNDMRFLRQMHAT